MVCPRCGYNGQIDNQLCDACLSPIGNYRSFEGRPPVSDAVIGSQSYGGHTNRTYSGIEAVPINWLIGSLRIDAPRSTRFTPYTKCEFCEHYSHSSARCTYGDSSCVCIGAPKEPIDPNIVPDPILDPIRHSAFIGME